MTVDLTPEHDWSDEAADAATLELMAAWPGSIGGDEVWAEQIGRIAAKAIWPLAYRAGREDAAKAIDDARAYPYIDVEKAKALARGQQPQPEPWQRRAAATGGGPCPTCRKPFWTHVCLSCSPDYQTPGKGCVNCRNSGMDQTPCKPAVDSIASQYTQDGDER